MVQAFSPDRADEPFGVSVLPGWARCGRSIADAHRPDPFSDDDAIGTISIADEVVGCLVPWESLDDLASNPFGSWVGGGAGPRQMASLETDHRQAIEKLEVDGRHDEQINGGDMRHVIADEGFPSL